MSWHRRPAMPAIDTERVSHSQELHKFPVNVTDPLSLSEFSASTARLTITWANLGFSTPSHLVKTISVLFVFPRIGLEHLF